MTYSNQDIAPKPYVQVSFPKEPPILSHPAGHDRYQRDLLHGTLHLTLEVQTSLHVSTGVVAMGSDVGNKIPLIKTMTQTISATGNKQLVIQGSSLKGCVRSIYEAITNSTLAVLGREKSKIPQERHPCEKKEELCPASRVFGAMNWQGLVSFADANCQTAQPSVGFMPSLYRPRPERPGYYGANGKVLGRKFYYNTSQAIDKGENRGIPVQQAGRSYTFDTVLHYRNLLPAELGIILIALGQDPKHPIALKLGGGKPIGMGTMTVTVTVIDQSADICDRYREYNLDRHIQLTESDLDRFIQQQIQAAHGSKLLQQTQLAELTQVLKYPSDRQPPSGMY
jgi:RAMP superfamily